jgi:hypothetical protein
MRGQSIVRACGWCGAVFKTKAAYVAGGGGRWCSRRCFNTARREAPQPPVSERFWPKVRKTGGCWEWSAATRLCGYGVLNVLGRTVDAHRISWELHYGPIPRGMVVCHRCDNPPCVRPDHLFLGTKRDNTHDMLRKGRGKNGTHSYGRGIVAARQDRRDEVHGAPAECAGPTATRGHVRGDRGGRGRDLLPHPAGTTDGVAADDAECSAP